MKVIAYCETCWHRHALDFDPLQPTQQCAEWYVKHNGHAGIGFTWPERTQKLTWLDRLRYAWHWRKHPSRDGLYHESWWPQIGQAPSALTSFLPNADVKLAYAASTAITITLASLAASTSLLAGRESTAVDNGVSNKYLDYLVSGFYRTAATNLQAGTILTALVGNLEDTPTWPDVFDGTDSVETVTLQAIYDSVCRRISEIATDATQRTWPWGPISVESIFGKIPDQFVLFVTHTAHTAANVWSAVEADHKVSQMGVYVTVV